MVVLSAEEVGHIQDIPHLPDVLLLLGTLQHLAAEAAVDRRTPHILDYTAEREYESDEGCETVVEIVDGTSNDDDDGGAEERRGYRGQ